MATEGSWLFEMFFLKMSGSVAFCFEDLAAIATLKKGERTISHTNKANFILWRSYKSFEKFRFKNLE